MLRWYCSSFLFVSFFPTAEKAIRDGAHSAIHIFPDIFYVYIGMSWGYPVPRSEYNMCRRLIFVLLFYHFHSASCFVGKIPHFHAHALNSEFSRFYPTYSLFKTLPFTLHCVRCYIAHTFLGKKDSCFTIHCIPSTHWRPIATYSRPIHYHSRCLIRCRL